MFSYRKILMILGLAAMLMAAVLVSGCGDDSKSASTSAGAPKCSPDQKSIIPPPSGKPQYVEFFRDT